MALRDRYKNEKIIPLLWELTLLLYLLRSIAEPLKYLFILAFAILASCYFLYLVRDFKKNTILTFFLATKEFHILGLLLIAGIIFSNQIQILSVKSIMNYFGMAFLFLVYFEFRDHIPVKRLFRRWILFTLGIGIFGLLKWFNFILGFDLGLFTSFYIPGTSLVSEYNFFASYFIVSLVVYLYALYTESVPNKLIINQAILISLIFIVAFTGSRRGFIVLAILEFLAVLLLIFKRDGEKKHFYKNLAFLNICFVGLLIIVSALVPFRSKIIQNEAARKNIASSVYRYTTLFKPNTSFSLFYNKLWPRTAAYLNDNTPWDKYASYNNIVDGEVNNKYRDLKNEFWRKFEPIPMGKNLFYNGDLQFGTKFWRIYAKANITHEIVLTKYGNAIRVSRSDGSGNWPLEYDGRQIVYYKGVNYTFRFKYRVVEGNGVPFKIGWWVDEGEGPKNDLDYTIKSLGAGWFEYSASYTFKHDQRNLLTFMNYQRKNTVIDFTDIELFSDDIRNRPNYLDQILQLEGSNLFYNSDFVYGLKFWGSVTRDSIFHRIVDTQYGKAVRVIRKDGKGNWPLAYQGREIYYHKDMTYYFRFKFRVIKGVGVPFKVGWRALEEKPVPYDLHKDVFPISDEWFECIAAYKFNQDQYGEILTFLNNQDANTIIDFTDIELLCNDTLKRFMYSDEMIDKINHYEEIKLTQELGSENQKLLAKRIDRWKYALNLWQEFPWYNKLLGNGFDYLQKFGLKFYPDEERIDYPHNPIISSFLYSGIIGGLFYLYFLSLSIYYYWKYRKQQMLFILIYFIYFIFILISGDNHFSIPIFAMLSLVPFITKHFAGEKEEKNHI